MVCTLLFIHTVKYSDVITNSKIQYGLTLVFAVSRRDISLDGYWSIGLDYFGFFFFFLGRAMGGIPETTSFYLRFAFWHRVFILHNIFSVKLCAYYFTTRVEFMLSNTCTQIRQLTYSYSGLKPIEFEQFHKIN